MLGARPGRFICGVVPDHAAPLTLDKAHPLHSSLVATDLGEGYAGSGRIMAEVFSFFFSGMQVWPRRMELGIEP